MWIFYAFAALPLAMGAGLWAFNRQVVWWEWLAGAALGFALAGVFQLLSVWGMAADTETWSGEISRVVHYPQWVEEYKVKHTAKVGKSTVTYYTTHYRTHKEYWTAETTLNQEFRVEAGYFNEIVKNFGGRITGEYVHKRGFDSGDSNIYTARNETGYLYPVTAHRSFENRIKAAPSLFSFAKIPAKAEVFHYPANRHWNQSDRLIGTAAKTVDILEWDRMNSRLGPLKLVNVIMAGFGDKPADAAQWQQAAWIGGKKNDLVLCYGGPDALRPSWAMVFGWTEAEKVKRDLESVLLFNPVDTSILPLIERTILASYQIKDWSKFDYITITPPIWAYWAYFIIAGGAQAAFWWWAHNNEEKKR